MTYTPYPQISIADGANLDAFSRLRTSNPVGLFTVQCQYDAEPFLMEAGATGVGAIPSHNLTYRWVDLVVNAGTGTSYFQSYEYIPYQPGKSQLAFLTFVLGAAVANAVVDVGLFDASNGFFLRQNGTSGLQLVRRTTAIVPVVTTDYPVNQASWNLDPLNGSGPSGVTLDVNDDQIMVIDAQFLGMGRVRVGFDIGGRIIYAHEFLHANVISVPYMQTLSLPIQMLVTSTATASAKLCAFKCASISSEGGQENPNAYSFATLEQTVTAGAATRTHILSLRPAVVFGALINRSKLQLSSVDVVVTGANPVFWELCIGSTFTVAPTWAAVGGGTASAAEQTTAVGTLNAAGTVIASGYVAATASAKSSASREVATRYPLTLDRANAQRANGTISLIVTGLTGASATRASFNYTEVR